MDMDLGVSLGLGINTKGLMFEFIKGCWMFNGEHIVFDSLSKAIIKGLIKCRIIPFNVRGQLSKRGHMTINMVIVKHFELANSLLRYLDDIELSK